MFFFISFKSFCVVFEAKCKKNATKNNLKEEKKGIHGENEDVLLCEWKCGCLWGMHKRWTLSWLMQCDWNLISSAAVSLQILQHGQSMLAYTGVASVAPSSHKRDQYQKSWSKVSAGIPIDKVTLQYLATFFYVSFKFQITPRVNPPSPHPVLMKGEPNMGLCTNLLWY